MQLTQPFHTMTTEKANLKKLNMTTKTQIKNQQIRIEKLIKSGKV